MAAPIQTVPLFHGPGALRAAVAMARAPGCRLVPHLFKPAKGPEEPRDSWGQGGLKADEARDIVSILQTVPVGQAQAFIVVGPLDEAAAKSCDVLLKAIEEPCPGTHRAILWANDLGGVTTTIRSRCRDSWAPAADTLDGPMEALGQGLVKGWLEGSYWGVPGAVQEAQGRETELLAAIARAVMAAGPRALSLWPRLRLLSLDQRGPTALELMAALRPGGA